MLATTHEKTTSEVPAPARRSRAMDGHAAVVALIALCSVGSYLVLERALGAAREPANETALLRALGGAVLLAVLALLALEVFAIVRPLARRAKRLAAAGAELSRTATTDVLTGMLNERGFQDRSTLEFHKAKRYNRPLSLLIIDPDGLDPITNRHGNAGGDIVLRALTATLTDSTRLTDSVARVGDEEFAVLLPETDVDGARLLAERLRAKIGELAMQIDDSVVSCTVSIGVAATENDASFFWPTLQRADRAVWEAKMRGRNRVFVNAA